MEINEAALNIFYESLGKWTIGDLCENIIEWDGYTPKPDLIGHKIKDKHDDWLLGIEATKSPIEQMLFARLLFATDGYNYLTVGEMIPPDYVGHFGTTLLPQYPVGDYTADFIIACQHHEVVSLIAIECDGHDFHEKTKHQAAHDKKRDRYFTAQGIKLLRFTGSEIFNRPDECLEEIESLIYHTMNAILIDAGKTEPSNRRAG